MAIVRRQRGRVVEEQHYINGNFSYVYYIQTKDGRVVQVPNLTDFNRNNEGKVLEDYYQRTQTDWETEFRKSQGL